MKTRQQSELQNVSASDLDTISEVRFYRASEKPFGAFSNLYMCSIEFEGELFASAEHAYQAGKARKAAVREWLLSAPTPSLVAMAAHGLYTWDVAPDWSIKKFERMKRVLFAKYEQHSGLRELLLSTGDARLIENATTDSAVNRLWGEVNGRGQNMLGRLLMEVRDDLRSRESSPVKKVKISKASSRTKIKVGLPRKDEWTVDGEPLRV